MDDFDSALAKWKKKGSDYGPTVYAHDYDKNTLYVRIDVPLLIEKYLPSAEKGLDIVFIEKSDTNLLKDMTKYVTSY